MGKSAFEFPIPWTSSADCLRARGDGKLCSTKTPAHDQHRYRRSTVTDFHRISRSRERPGPESPSVPPGNPSQLPCRGDSCAAVDDIFILNATRRLQADRFYTDNYDEQTYTAEGLAWIDEADFKSVLLRHDPALAGTGLANVRNAFEPWDTSERLDPERHPLRAYGKELRNVPWLGDARRQLKHDPKSRPVRCGS